METRETSAAHPIQVVSRRTGLSQDVLRAWEKRYHAVEPFRSPTGRRLYTDQDIRRLLLLHRATRAGRSIGQVAHLPDPELEELVSEDERASAAAPEPAGRRGGPRLRRASGAAAEGELLQQCVEAVRALDSAALETALDRAAVEMSRPALLDDLLLPLMRRLGEEWKGGALRVAHEHLASAVVRSFLGGLREGFSPAPGAPRLLVTTPPGQLHELGALAAAVTASAAGWAVTYLGPNLPTEEVVAAADRLEARCVALSLVYPVDDPRMTEELRRLRRLLPERAALLVGGPAAGAYAPVLDDIGAIRLRDMASLRTVLEELRTGASPSGPSR